MMVGINMAEWDTGPHREMAVDVPDSFVARTKTPPRYPPPKHDETSPGALRKKATVTAATATATATATSNGVKPTLPSREHLRIEEDGRLVNRAVPPQVHLHFTIHPEIHSSFAYFHPIPPGCCQFR